MSREGWLPAFEAFAEDFFARHEVPGGAVAVVSGDEVLLARGFGLRDREAGVPASEDTIFGVASLSKSFTALTILSLAAEGILDLDDPVTRWLPDFHYPGLGSDQPVRLRHMLSHTTGIPPLRALDFGIHPSQLGDPAEVHNRRSYQGAPQVASYQDLLAYLRRGEGPLIAPPGQVVSYSNDAYGLLGAVIEEAAGRPFDEAVRERVFRPLGMDGAGFDVAQARASGRLTQLYTRTPEGAVIASPQWEEAPAHAATGFMKASVRDLARSLSTLILARHEALGLGPRSLPSLFEPRGWAEPGTQYGLGWMLHGDHDGVRLVRHGGSLKGISAHQGFVPELGLGVAVLANLDEVPVKRLWMAAVNGCRGRPLETPLYPVPGVPAALPEGGVAGVYLSGEPWGRMEVREEDGALEAFTGEDGSHAGRIAWLDRRTFVLATNEGAWAGGRFHFGDDGEAYAVQQGMRLYVRRPEAAG